MLKPYQTIEDVLASPWAQQPQAERMERTDRVLRSTKLENNIYHDLRAEDTAMDEIEQSAGEKLKSFPALSQDVFQSFYSLMPRRNDEAALSAAARKFNAPILEHITQSEEYRTLKEVCEGRELPAYVPAKDFRPDKRSVHVPPRGWREKGRAEYAGKAGAGAGNCGTAAHGIAGAV